MQAVYIGLILLTLMSLTTSTCVLESEFGFILNCNFKKTGLFRVRNLGGLKAHFGLGFSLGDELGFGESLGNLEGNRRRALNYKTGFINKVGVISENIDLSAKSSVSPSIRKNITSMTEAVFLPLGVPTFKPVPKLQNNLVRRKDVLLPEINDKRNSDYYFMPQIVSVKGKTTVFSPEADSNGSRIGETNDYSSLVNISKSYDKNRMQIVEDTSSGVLSKRPQLKNYNATTINRAPNSVQSLKVMVVMNAPKEYYPSGYDKSFDDNFKSRVELPQTDFACAEQKFFPGLYANIDMGCMIFHVCAVTDGGIITKSFLCPESTLFDQSILKCNWWFYVDCVNSSYDSNIPISKTYQLMKSLSYFSNYTKVQSTIN